MTKKTLVFSTVVILILLIGWYIKEYNSNWKLMQSEPGYNQYCRGVLLNQICIGEKIDLIID